MKRIFRQFETKLSVECRFFIAVIVSFSGSVSAQSVDSLEQMLTAKNLTPREKIEIYNKLTWGYLNTKLEGSVYFSKKGLEISRKIKDKKSEAEFYKTLGFIYQRKGKTDSALIFPDYAKTIIEKSDNYLSLTSLYNNYAIIHKTTGNYDKALEYYLINVRLLEKNRDENKLAFTYFHIGSVYQKTGNFEKAVDYGEIVDRYANENFQKFLSSIEIKHETEKKNLELRHLRNLTGGNWQRKKNNFRPPGHWYRDRKTNEAEWQKNSMTVSADCSAV